MNMRGQIQDETAKLVKHIREEAKSRKEQQEKFCGECNKQRFHIDSNCIAVCDLTDNAIDNSFLCWGNAEKKIAEKKLAKKYKEFDIPVRYSNLKLEGSEVTRILSQFSPDIGRCLILSGGIGCGKTYGLYAFLIEKCHPGDVIFVRAPDMYSSLMINIDITEKYKKTGLLLIDDLATEYQAESGFWESRFDEIMDFRYSHLLTTIITTNLALEDFRKRYPKRFIDRLREWGEFVEIKEKSRRKKT